MKGEADRRQVRQGATHRPRHSFLHQARVTTQPGKLFLVENVHHLQRTPNMLDQRARMGVRSAEQQLTALERVSPFDSRCHGFDHFALEAGQVRGHDHDPVPGWILYRQSPDMDLMCDTLGKSDSHVSPHADGLLRRNRDFGGACLPLRRPDRRQGVQRTYGEAQNHKNSPGHEPHVPPVFLPNFAQIYVGGSHGSNPSLEGGLANPPDGKGHSCPSLAQESAAGKPPLRSESGFENPRSCPAFINFPTLRKMGEVRCRSG